MDSESSLSAEASCTKSCSSSSTGPSSDIRPSLSTVSTQSAGPSQEVLARQTPRIVPARLSRDALAAKAYAARVTKMHTVTGSTVDESSSDIDKSTSTAHHIPKPAFRPPSRVGRARIHFADVKHTIVREAVMPDPDDVPTSVYYHLMRLSFINLKDILNKIINVKITSPSPIIPKKRRSSGATKIGSSTKISDKPSKKAKKIII